MRRLAAVLVLVLSLSLGAGAVARAQIGPLPPGPQQPPPQPTPQPTPQSNRDEGLSGTQQALILAAAVALLAGIAFVIVRDARRAAPTADRAGGGEQPKRSARERERSKRERRDKAKAARRQRKRNRPR